MNSSTSTLGAACTVGRAICGHLSYRAANGFLALKPLYPPAPADQVLQPRGIHEVLGAR